MRHTPGVTGVFESELVGLMRVAHISGRYHTPVGSSRGLDSHQRYTPSVSVQLVGGVLTFDMQKSLGVHPACLRSNALCLPTITFNAEVTHFSTSGKLSDGSKKDLRLGFSLGSLQNCRACVRVA